jgi:hypothetical protein
MKAQHVTRVLSLVVVLFMHSAWVPMPWRYSKSALVGAYEINYPFGSDTLILNADDSYEQIFTAKDGRAFTNRGKWTLERRWHNQIRLENAVLVCSAFGEFASTDPQEGCSFFSAGWYGGGIVLGVSEDLGLYMRKVR